MRTHKLGIILLLVILSLGYFTFSKINTGQKKLAKDVSQAELDLKSSKRLQEMKKGQVDKIASGGVAVEEYIKVWTPFIKGKDAAAVFEDLDRLATSNNLQTLSRRSKREPAYKFGSIPVLEAQIDAVGQYEGIHGWVGEVENKYPHGLLKSVIIERKQESVVGTLTLVIPDFSPQEKGA